METAAINHYGSIHWGMVVVGLWTLASYGWWVLAAFLGGFARLREKEFVEDFYRLPYEQNLDPVSVFKPLPHFDGKGPDLNCRTALMTFFQECAQPGVELILGVHFEDALATQIWLDEVLPGTASGLRLKVIYRDSPDACANPKVAWLERLASEATHDLWLWSDADILVREGWLCRFRREWNVAQRKGQRLLSASYVIPVVERLCGVPEMMYVNAEFYPGVRLLNSLGSVDFAMGAAVLFRRVDFEREGGFSGVRNRIADDYALGQMLQPCAVATERVLTFSAERTLPGAVRHYLRWQRTVRWNKPGAYLAQLLILPLLPWLLLTGYAVCLSGNIWVVPFIFFITVLLTEPLLPALTAAQATTGELSTPRGGAFLLWCWNLMRYAGWLYAWMPFPVQWGGKIWWRPEQSQIKQGVHHG